MPNEQKRHHIVPQFYLRGFAAGDERLTAIDTSRESKFSTVVRKAASQTHFYRLRDDHPEGPLGFEQALGGVESDVDQIFKRIADGVWPLTVNARRQLSFFLGTQVLRGPRFRQALMNSGRVGTNPDGSAMTDVEIHAHQIATLAEEWMPHLMDRPWALVHFDAPSLITSDSPVSSIKWPEDESRTRVLAPFEVAKEVLYPVSRKLGLIFRSTESIAGGDSRRLARLGVFDHRQLGSVSLGRYFNESTAATATNYIYHHPDDGSLVPRKPRTVPLP